MHNGNSRNQRLQGHWAAVVAAIVVALLWLSACGTVYPVTPHGTLAGVIADFAGPPLDAATLTCIPVAASAGATPTPHYSKQSGSDGSYQLALPAVDQSLYACTAMKGKVASSTLTVRVAANVTTTANFSLCVTACPGGPRICVTCSPPQYAGSSASAAVRPRVTTSLATTSRDLAGPNLVPHPLPNFCLLPTPFPSAPFCLLGNTVINQSFQMFFVYWDPPGSCFNGCGAGSSEFDYMHEPSIFADLASGIGSGTNPYRATLSQYLPLYGARAVLNWVDTRPFPGGRGTRANPLTAADVANEVRNARQVNNWPYSADSNGVVSYVIAVFTPTGIQSCAFPNASAPQPQCSFPTATDTFYYCGFHSATIDDLASPYTQSLVYIYLPDAGDRKCGTPTTVAPLQNNVTLSQEVDVFSHEFSETLTDPYLNAWYDVTSQEIGDKCVGVYGAIQPDGSDVTLPPNGRYIIQQEWSNNINGCSLGS